MMDYLLHDFLIEKHIKNALEEDIGFGDITTDYLVDNNHKITAYLRTREDGIICGLKVFKKVFEVLNNNIEVTFYKNEGDIIKKGDKIAKIEGEARCILTGERTALNYIQRMSGIATCTFKYVEKISKYNVKIVDTRKNTPGFRMFEKYSVKIGKGSLHRFNLSDCVMIKDNHISLAGGSIKNAVEKIRKYISHAHKIEVECDTLDQVKEALDCNVDIIMLDNMNIEEMKKSVEIINKRAIVESSGNITLETIEDIAKTNVDIISTSSIVAKAKTLDLGLDF